MQNTKPATNSITNTIGIEPKPANSPPFENGKVPSTGTSQGVATTECSTKPLQNTYKIHPVANTLHRYDITDLVASIKEQGQIDPVLLWRPNTKKALQLINGRHRMWACNELGIKVHYQILQCLEEDLPEKILDQQLLSRGTDKVFATITLMEYLQANTGTASALVKKYKNLAIATRDIGDAKTIAELMPTWITTLKLGKGVRLTGNGYAEVKSLRAIAKECRALHKEAESTPTVREISEATPESIAISKLLTTITTVLDNADTLIDSDAKGWVTKTLALRYATLNEITITPIDDYEPHEDYGELLIEIER